MTITLNGLIHEGKTPIAVPAFRIGLSLNKGITDPDNAAAIATITRSFIEHFGDAIGFVAINKSGSRPARLTQPTAAKMKKVDELINEGLSEKMGLRLYGPDTGPLGAPAGPFLSVHQQWTTQTILELALPWDHPSAMMLADHVDQAIRSAHVRVGFMGYGFFCAPVGGLEDRYLPPAHERFRAASLGRWAYNSEIFVWDKAVEGWTGPYRPGLPDMGWRTYVGDPFRERLKDPANDLDPSVVIEQTDRMTVVTAGPQPIWGDVNAGEDISAYRAAYSYLLPAMADRSVLRSILGGAGSSPQRADVIDSYLDRFA